MQVLEALKNSIPDLLDHPQHFEYLANTHDTVIDIARKANGNVYDKKPAYVDYLNKWQSFVEATQGEFDPSLDGASLFIERFKRFCIEEDGFEPLLDLLYDLEPAAYQKLELERKKLMFDQVPYTKKAEHSELLQEVFPNTSLEPGSVDRAVASWSVTAHAMARMEKSEVMDIFSEFDRILKPGGRATLFPMDYKSDYDEDNLRALVKEFNKDFGGDLGCDFRIGIGRNADHLVMILIKEQKPVA